MSSYKCAALKRFFTSMSYSANLTLSQPFERLEERRTTGGERGTQPQPSASAATSQVCPNFCNLTGPDAATRIWAHFLKRPTAKPTGLSEQSEDSSVPGIKITADKWGSNWRHISALSSNFAVSFEKLAIGGTVKAEKTNCEHLKNKQNPLLLLGFLMKLAGMSLPSL